MGAERFRNVPSAEVDKRTEVLLGFLGFGEKDSKLVDVGPYGKLKQRIVLANIRRGMNIGQIKFEWLEKRNKQKEVEILFEEVEGGKRIRIILNESLLVDFGREVDKLMPGGSPMKDSDPDSYRIDFLRKSKPEQQEKMKNWNTLKDLLAQVYILYRQI